MKSEISALALLPDEENLMDIIRHTSSSVWKVSITNKEIGNWLNNFTGKVYQIPEERRLALWLLSHFTFYNNGEVAHLCKVLYREFVHFIIRTGNKDPEKDLQKYFQKSTFITHESLSSSGGFIAYLFRHENNIPMEFFGDSKEKISQEIENILIIDDVTLTPGKQGHLHKFLSSFLLKNKNKKIHLLTLISSEEAKASLKDEFGVDTTSAIILDQRDKCFSPQSDAFFQYPELLPIGKKFAEYYGTKILKSSPLGYGNGEYTFGFYYNTPNNTLPIFWGRSNWFPIVNRYNKKYKGAAFLEEAAFV